jgi:LiaI-LiaF-like transmembrane region
MKRSPAAAVWLSLLPGLGHLYVGYTTKGLTLALLAVGVIQITSESDGPFGMFIPFVWLFAMIDAHRSAVEANRLLASGGQLPRAGFDLSKWWGYVLIGLGGLLVLENFGVIDFDWIWRFWPLGLIAAGIYILKGKPPTSGTQEPTLGTPAVPPVPPVDAEPLPASEPGAVEQENV